MPFTPQYFEAQVAKTGYSRFIITDENEECLGYIHLKDLLYADTVEKYKAPVKDWRIRKLISISDQENIDKALSVMQKNRVHLCSVTQNNKIIGVIFLEDILEELVGTVRDSLQRIN